MKPELRYRVYKRPMIVPVFCPKYPVRPQCSVTSYLITRFRVSLGVPNVYFPTEFLTKYINLEPRINATYNSLLILIYFVILIFVETYEEFYFYFYLLFIFYFIFIYLFIYLFIVIFPVVLLDLRLHFTLLCNIFFSLPSIMLLSVKQKTTFYTRFMKYQVKLQFLIHLSCI